MKAFIVTAGIWMSVSAIAFAQATEEELNNVQSVVTRAERLSSRITALKTQAEREKDIIRVNCLNTKLAEVNANLRAASTRLNSLRTETDQARIKQALTVALVLGQKLQVLDQEANQCVGQSLFNTGATKVDTSIDNSVVPSEQEAQTTTIPEVVSAEDPGTAQTIAPPDPKETSPNGDEG